MAELLHLELVTPERRVFADDVRMVVAPALEGDVGILPHHSAMTAMLRTGVIEVHDSNGAVQKYHSNGGYVSVMNNNCIILADSLNVEAD